MKHTPEPWRTYYEKDAECYTIVGADGTPICDVISGKDEKGKDDAERIVACVNALAGSNF